MRGAIAVLALWVHAHQAYAGVPIALPDQEEVGPWLIPLQLAGLEPAGGPARLQVTRTEDTERWQLRAVDAQGQERVVEVPRPRTPRDREELAFLARGLVRDLGDAPTPAARRAPHLPAPPPPPPSLVVAPAPEVTAPEPSPPRAEGTDEEAQPEPEPPPQAPQPVLPPESQVKPTDTAPRVWEFPENGPEERKSPRRRRRKRPPTPFEVPSLALGFHSSFRPSVQPGFSVTLGLRAPQPGLAFAEVRMRATANRALLQTDLVRQILFVDIDAFVGTTMLRSGSVGVGAAMSYRVFRQQFTPIDTSLAPVVFTNAEIPLLSNRRRRRARPGRWAVNLDLQARLDLQRTEMILEDQSRLQLLPVEIGTGITVRFFGAGDLFVRPPTSTER
ncbi:MAG: hypothetical protein KTR31_31990 [Myxococcales bacterium]|nr:hypothetical protein [Myxococcales bacterium]